jgi:hypothetical protein
MSVGSLLRPVVPVLMLEHTSTELVVLLALV